jgi:S-adenosylmethionine:tRNA ribosyltransferase-isomerase
VLVSEFDYNLPSELIAQQPLADRAGARLLHLQRQNGGFTDRSFTNLPELLRPGDLLVVNNTRVFPARLYGYRKGTTAQPVSPRNPAAKQFLRGRVEVLLTRPIGVHDWEALVRPGRKIGIGETLTFGDGRLQAEVIGRGEFGERTLRFDMPGGESFFQALEQLGHIPLPPYIGRPDSEQDRERYQTVFSKLTGSAAAPTAGLHFTPAMMDRIRERGVEIAEVTLHVGLGTFQPLRHERVEENRLHQERFEISTEAAAAVNRARTEGRRVLAVGTTTVRTLEYAVRQSSTGEFCAGNGAIDLFIYPGFEFKIVAGLLTNFHLPQSSLLMLVCAFGGKQNVLRAYDHAVKERYRFFSYGDCMWID